jgi:hypothetical protein
MQELFHVEASTPNSWRFTCPRHNESATNASRINSTRIDPSVLMRYRIGKDWTLGYHSIDSWSARIDGPAFCGWKTDWKIRLESDAYLVVVAVFKTAASALCAGG